MASECYEQVEVWEALKAFVAEAAPEAAWRIERRRAAEWRTCGASEGQVLALMVNQDMDYESAALRRRARAAVRALVGSDDDRRESRDEEWDRIGKLSPAVRTRLVGTLEWISVEPPAEWLTTIAGPQGAVAHVHRRAKALGGLRAHRWLGAIGYPVATPDLPRQRFLLRMGWIERAEMTTGAQAEAMAAMELLARAAEASLGEVDAILDEFTGANSRDCARGAARCVVRPLCHECPLQAHCTFFRLAGAESVAESRSLLLTTRQEDRPRERLEREGAQALGEDELIAILLRTGSGRENALDLARRLLVQAGTLERVAAMSVAEMAKIPGLGRVKAITIRAACELARRLRAAQPALMAVRNSRTVFERFEARFLGAKKEEFLVLLLNTKNEITREVTVSKGTLNQSLVHPREAFTEAIRDTAHAVIFVHNHPSGDPSPSRDDVNVTARLVKAGEIVGVKVLDHIVIGQGRYYSFADEGQLHV